MKIPSIHHILSPVSQIDVSCVKIHPQADLNDTLANNIAVMKLDVPNPPPPTPAQIQAPQQAG